MSRSFALTWTPSAVATPFVRQWQKWSAVGNNGGLDTLTLDQPVLAGSSLVVFASDTNFNGTPQGSGTPDPITVSDTQGGSWSSLFAVPDQYEFDALTGLVRTNVGAGLTDVTVHWLGNQWQGAVIAEVANVGASPTIHSTGLLTVNPTPHSADAISTGTLVLGSSPALLVALSYNATDILTSEGYPDAGTGFTPHVTAWDWGGPENTSNNDVAMLESKYLASPGTVAATFTPRTPGPNDENFLAIVIAFQ